MMLMEDFLLIWLVSVGKNTAALASCISTTCVTPPMTDVWFVWRKEKRHFAIHLWVKYQAKCEVFQPPLTVDVAAIMLPRWIDIMDPSLFKDPPYVFRPNIPPLVFVFFSTCHIFFVNINYKWWYYWFGWNTKNAWRLDNLAWKNTNPIYIPIMTKHQNSKKPVDMVEYPVIYKSITYISTGEKHLSSEPPSQTV